MSSDELALGGDSSFAPNLIDRAIALARQLQERATELQTPAERRQQAELNRMLETPADKVTLVELTDQAFRSKGSARTAEQFTHILDVQGVPRFFSPLDRALLRGFQTFGGWLPGVAVPLVKEHMQQETANVVLPAETELLTEHLRARSHEGVRMNLNFLGESLMGEEEASHRLERYLEALQYPEVEVMSVKISTLYSQIAPVAREHTLRVLCDRLELLYRAADRIKFKQNDGTETAKFIYLDMEEYRDLHLTAQCFMRTLDRPGLRQSTGGIALQAYIPDSAQVQREINAWARPRVAAGGAPVTIRLVKGANMEMERVEASLRDWPQAPFKLKPETDANYKRMLQEAMRPDNLAAVRIGVASHNLFDLAYGVVLAQQSGMQDRVQFEMLEGMANHQRRALLEQTHNLLLYAPACRKEEFLNAIGYLIRRLDENTGPHNFLRHAFKLKVGTPEWIELERGFRDSFALTFTDAPRRTQNRLTEQHSSPWPEMRWQELENEPDTDFSLPNNSQWAQAIVDKQTPNPVRIPLIIDGEPLFPTPNNSKPCLDPSRPGVVLTQYRQATEAEIDQAVAAAVEDRDGWRQLTVDDRNQVLGRVAEELRKSRGELISAALANGGKIITEADVEVSEAVDFVEFYRSVARYFYNEREVSVKASPKGVIVVIPPWNFPIAIPCGGIAAALAAGNTVLLKPASDTVLVAWELCQCFWRAGISRRVLQFVPCSGGGAGAYLAAHPHVDAVILTGGTETARRMLELKPTMRLFAETGGKNATIVTALADRELAIKHVAHSAFSHSGQKCSATSLLLLEAEVYDDPDFKRMLCDAVKSLSVGSAWELQTRVGPLIRPPSGDLETGLKTLEAGETWAVMPRPVNGNPNLWSPGVKYGVRAGSYTHQTEFFGPVLGVMRFERLEEAIEIVNQTGYGLTSGLHSLDDREHAVWKKRIQAGNLYINRGTTGAIVLRQPFGGMGKSCFGPGMKAGGPNYLAQLLRFQDGGCETGEVVTNRDLASLYEEIGQLPAIPGGERARIRDAITSYDHWWRAEFSKEHDHFHLLGQDNHRRYLPFPEIRVRINTSDTFFEIVARVAAARATGARVVVSAPAETKLGELVSLDLITHDWAAGIEFVEESDEQMLTAAHVAGGQRIRYAAPDRVPESVRATLGLSAYIADEPVLAAGRIELLWYLREQSVCYDYHRYGNLGARGGETRREPI